MSGRTDYRDVSIPKSAADEIEALLSYAEQLGPAIELATKTKPAVAVVTILRDLSKQLSIRIFDLRKIFNALENLNVIRKEFGGAEIAFEKIAEALSPEAAKKWSEKKALILSAMAAYSEDNPVSISVKAQKLTFLREKIYRDAEIITDARPVYDSTGEKVLEILITHSLVANYLVRDRVETVHLAMDAADVLKLRKACDRAIVKAKALKTALGDKSDWVIEVLRDEDNVSN